MSASNGGDHGAADYLWARRGGLTRHWLRAVRQEMRIRPQSREAVVGLIDQLPLLFSDLCLLLPGNAASDETALRAAAASRIHAQQRWRQGFTLDELYLELDLLQRCVHAALRNYYAESGSRAARTRTHEIVEAFFSEAIRTAIACYESEAYRRVEDALSERDRAFTAQRRSDERLRLAAEAAGLGIFEWDPETDEAVWENDRMFEITGQPPARGPLGVREFAELLARPEDRARLAATLGKLSSEPADVHNVYEIRKVHTGVPAVIEISARLLPDASGTRRVLVGTMADVTDRVRAEQALRDADRRKDVFLATLAHELRNPLAPILNAAQLLRRRGLSDPQLRWAQGLIERHAGHLSHLIDDLLDLSRIAAGKIRLREEVFDVRSALDRAVEINLPAANERRQRLDVSAAQHGPLYLHGDPTRITQVVANLLDNAIKYTERGGHIRLTLDQRDAHAVIVVEDNGIGIAPEFVPFIFETFEQEDLGGTGTRGGLGIGLSVARSLIAMHGGSIEAASPGRGKGSRFIVRLPLCDTREGVAPVAARLPAEGAPCRVLIVDDNEDAAMSLAALLEGHDVRTASRGREALVAARQFRPDIVFLDLALPDMDGFEVARRLLARVARHDVRPRPVLVALTGHGQPEDRERTRRAGFDHHLVKPAAVEEIERLVRLAKEAGNA